MSAADRFINNIKLIVLMCNNKCACEYVNIKLITIFLSVIMTNTQSIFKKNSIAFILRKTTTIS